MIIGKGLSTTMIYTHILQQGGHGVPSPIDDLGVVIGVAEADRALHPMPTARLAAPFLVAHTRCLPERVRQFEAGASPGKDGTIDRDRAVRGRMTVLAFCM